LIYAGDKKMKKCPDCGSKNIAWKNVELMCNKCGFILEESFFSGERILV
jgi:transcription initiation factor TFIIIB Brf1 subunit/transcription initiation factor TFIIB